MLLRHFEQLRPICPTCRLAGREPSPLALGNAWRQEGEEVLEAVLECPQPLCQREHPVIDGIPVIVPDFRLWAQYQLDAVLRRRDLSDALVSLLGDAAGPDSGFDRDRSTLSTYALSHWGDHQSPHPQARERTAAALADSALELAGEALAGSWIDLGCGAGRATFELAMKTGGLVVAADLNFEMLRIAAAIQRFGQTTYQQRRFGLVYETRQITAPEFLGTNIAVWCCDVSALPFADGTFTGALSLNVVDSVASPLAHLREMRRVVEPAGNAVVGTPYEWTAQATPVEQWIGGHSQRGPSGGASEPVLRRLLEAPADDGGAGPWSILKELEGVPWFLSTHERSVVEYSLHMLRLGKPE